MKKVSVFLLLVCVVLTFSACMGGTFDTDETNSKNTNNKDTVSSSAVYSYFGNKRTKIFHKGSCPQANNAKNDNIYVTDSREELINEGYVPCKVCNP